MDFISFLPHKALHENFIVEGLKFYIFSVPGNTHVNSSTRQFNFPKMSKRGVYVVLVGCLLIHVLFTLDQPSYFFRSIVGSINIGIALLFFPLIGFLAGVFYKISLDSIILCNSVNYLDRVLSSEVIVYFVFGVILHESISKQGPITYTLCVVIIIFGIGLFDANAIQFGMDQLLEASSIQLSHFIHWYFWFMHLGQPIVFCVCF